MSIPSLKKQYFGDFNEMLRRKRAEMNQEIREKCLEILAKKKEGDKDGINI